MKKTSIFFALSFLGALALQNASSEEPKPYKLKPYKEAYSEKELRIIKYEEYGVYSEEPRIMKLTDPASRRYVLWRIYAELSDTNSNARMLATVDSVLIEDFYAKEKFLLVNKKEGKSIKKIIDPNNYYLVLAIAGCDEKSAAKGKCFLVISKIDYIIPDTPENRKFLSKKWSETRILYAPLESRPNGREIDM